MALGIKLGYWIRKAAKQEEAAAEGEGGLESVQLEIADTDKWEKDGDTHVCAVCEQGFKVSDRHRHHHTHKVCLCRYRILVWGVRVSDRGRQTTRIPAAFFLGDGGQRSPCF